MTDVKLLPLPNLWKYDGRGHLIAQPTTADMQAYARACVEANTEALRAEVERLEAGGLDAMRRLEVYGATIEALRAEVDALRSRLEDAIRDGLNEHLRAERLAEALHHLIERCDDSDGAQYGTLGASFVRDVCAAALHPTAAQEGK